MADSDRTDTWLNMISLSVGFSAALFESAIHFDQSFRNHNVGRRCSFDVSGPRLIAVILIKYIFRTGFGIFRKHIKVSVFVKNTGIE